MFRLRSDAYLKLIRGQPCLVCGNPGEAHHLTFAQPRGLGLKSGDQFCVPLCHPCHMDLHVSPMPEKTWWALRGIDALIWAINHYEKVKYKYGNEIVSRKSKPPNVE